MIASIAVSTDAYAGIMMKLVPISAARAAHPFDANEIRHPDVADGNIEVALAQQFQHIGAVTRLCNRTAGTAQVGCKHLPDRRFIVHDRDFQGFHIHDSQLVSLNNFLIGENACTRVPAPGVESISMRPSWFFMVEQHNDKPRPAPLPADLVT